MVDSLWLVILASLCAWAVWAGHELLFLCGVLGLLVAASIKVSRRFSLVGVACHRALSAARAELGEVIELTVALTNRKVLPLASLRIEDELPRALEVEGSGVTAARGHVPPQLV